MKLSFLWKTLVPSVMFSCALVVPALAQSDSGATASESMKAAGESMEKAGSDTLKGAEHAYHGSATALRDSKITFKVKTALHDDNATKDSDIHVSTSAGVVTLNGRVDSSDVSRHAGRLTQNTEGVKDVDNQIRVSGASSTQN